MKRRSLFAGLSVVALGLLLMDPPTEALACALCKVQYHVYTVSRQITGQTLTQECPGGGHSAPFGNWGADTGVFGSRVNGRQFDGWVLIDNLWQWNSCTSRQDLYPFGDPEYYNASTQSNGPFSAQVTATGVRQASRNAQTTSYTVSCPSQGPLGERGGCKNADGFTVLEDVIMSLYELDGFPLPGDDLVAILDYTGFNRLQVRLDCTVSGCQTDPFFQVYNGAVNNGVFAFSTISVVSSGLFLTNCDDEGPKREF